MKRMAWMIFTAAALMISALPLKAQDARASVQAVLARMVPNKRFPDDMIVTGQVTEGTNRPQPFRIVVKGKDNIRYEVGEGASTVITILSKETGSRQASGKVELLKPYTAVQRPALIPFLDLLAEAESSALLISDRGGVSLGAMATRRYTLKLPDPAPQSRMYGKPLDEETDFYVDPVSGLVVRSERWLMTENSMDIRFRSISDFSDYRNVEGLAMPFRIATAVIVPSRRQPFQSLYVISNVVLNSGVPDSTFSPEEEAKR